MSLIIVDLKVTGCDILDLTLHLVYSTGYRLFLHKLQSLNVYASV